MQTPLEKKIFIFNKIVITFICVFNKGKQIAIQTKHYYPNYLSINFSIPLKVHLRLRISKSINGCVLQLSHLCVLF